MNEITISLTPQELATFIDCTPSIYNRLDKATQRIAGDLRNTPSYETAVWKFVDAADENL